MTDSDDRGTSSDSPTGSVPLDANSEHSSPRTTESSSSMQPATTISGIVGDNIYPTTTTTSKSLRQQLGSELAHISDIINNNLIVVRYATFSTVLLLGVYGIANTPLFYRYKHVLDIPQQMFQKRKCIHGRIVGVVAAESEGMRYGIRKNPEKADSIQHEHRPIVVLFRHSSPMERLLTQSAMERVLSSAGKSTTSLLYSSVANPYHNLLPIELAGISAPPSTSTTSLTRKPTISSQFPLLDQLIQQKTKVSLQLLAQRTTQPVAPTSIQQNNRLDTNTRDIVAIVDDNIKHAAICHLHYHPSNSWFKSVNASLEMVRRGQAWMNPNGDVVALPPSNLRTSQFIDKAHGLHAGATTTATLVNFNPTVKQLRDDTQFLSKVEEAEYAAWKSKVGMWSTDEMRELRTEYLAEEESSKTKWQIRSIINRGWEWMIRKS
ncbi:hypothetical protein ACHAWU_009096 [Discostella pseudostelligera]|uniref:Uncharacterized protein n=1 Tax=Discostella pseudostelligera TaxID=259834 RepID=A0ABD3MN94_9STRA